MFNPQFYNLLGQQAMQAQKAQEAFNHFSTAIGLNPNFAEARVNRGVLLFSTGDKDRQKEALEDFNRAIESDPHAINGWLNRAIARGTLGDLLGKDADLKSAIAAANEAVARAPKSLEPWIARSQLRQKLGDPAGAATDLEMVVELAPPDWPSLANVKQMISTLKAAPRSGL